MSEFLAEINWSPLWISLKTGFTATVIAFFLGIFFARLVMKMKPVSRGTISLMVSVSVCTSFFSSLVLPSIFGREAEQLYITWRIWRTSPSNSKSRANSASSASEFSIRTPLASSFSLSTSVRKLSGISASSRPPTYYKKSRHHPELFPPELLPLDPSGPCKALSLFH